MYDTIDDRDKAEEQFTTFFDEPVKDMDMDDLVEKYYETLPSTVYQKNREDLQLLIMSQLTGYIDGFQDSETIDSVERYTILGGAFNYVESYTDL